jgi:hypothetical protein
VLQGHILIKQKIGSHTNKKLGQILTKQKLGHILIKQKIRPYINKNKDWAIY